MKLYNFNCIRSLVPNINYLSNSTNNSLIIERNLDFDESTTTYIGSSSFDENTNEIIIKDKFYYPRNIRCVFADGVVVTIPYSYNKIIHLRPEIKISISSDSLKLYGTFSRNDSMFCALINKRNRHQKSFSTCFKKYMNLVVNELLIRRFNNLSMVQCDNVDIRDKSKCSESLNMVVYMKVGNQQFPMETLAYKVMDEHLFIGTKYPQLQQQLRQYIKYFSPSDKLDYTYVSGDIIRKGQLSMGSLETDSNWDVRPFEYVDRNFKVSSAQTVSYIMEFYGTQLQVNLKFYVNDSCGALKLYTCMGTRCLSSVSECLFYDPEEEDINDE